MFSIKNIKILVLTSLITLLGLVVVFPASRVMAAATCFDPRGGEVACDSNPSFTNLYRLNHSGGLPQDGCFRQDAFVGFIQVACDDPTGPEFTDADPTGIHSQTPQERADQLVCADNDDGYCNFVHDYLNPGIKLLSVLVGIIVTAMIIVGGIQYSAAGADPGAVEKAKKRIFSAILALVGYGLLFAFLQFLIPGGVV